MHEWVHCHDKAASHQCPSLWPSGSSEYFPWRNEWLSLMQNLMPIHCSTLSVIWMQRHTVHMLTQWHLLPPRTHTVKLALFTYLHSSPLSLAARFRRCHANCSRYINNGWTSSGQISLYVIPSTLHFGKSKTMETVKISACQGLR